MADNTVLNLGAGGDTIATKDLLGRKVPQGLTGFLNAGGTDVTNVAASAPLPIYSPAGATSFAKAEDTLAADQDVGVPSLAVRKATPANTSGTDGDYEFLQMSAGRLWTSTVIDTALPAGSNAIGIVDTELPAAAALADAASATPSTPTMGAVGLVMNATTLDRQRAVVNSMDTVGTGIAAAGIVGQLDDVATGTVTENQFSTVRISSRRALLVEGVASGTAQPSSIPSGGVASGAYASGSIASGAIASGAVASGAFAAGSIAVGAVAAGAASFVKLEDVASADADAGVPALAVRKATPANTSSTDGDYEFLQISAGRLWTSSVIDTALPAGTNLIGVSISPQQTSAIYSGTTALTPKFAVISTSSSGVSTVVAAVGGKKIRVLSYRYQSDADVGVKFRDNTAPADLTGVMATGAKGGGAGASFNPVGHFETAIGNALSINLSSAVQVSGHIVYVEV